MIDEIEEYWENDPAPNSPESSAMEVTNALLFMETTEPRKR